MDPLPAEDSMISGILDWALARMSSGGYPINCKVSIAVDPELTIMGYATRKGDEHCVIVAGWALDSEMLGGLVLHELAHVYHTEKGSASHEAGLLQEVISDLAEVDGPSGREREYLIDCFSHLQNILVDDIVFDLLTQKELEQARRFFVGWVSERPTGDPVADAALVCRNAFAVASLRRRNAYRKNGEMESKNAKLVAALGKRYLTAFEELEAILEDARCDLSAPKFRSLVESYLEKVLSLMRERAGFEEFR